MGSAALHTAKGGTQLPPRTPHLTNPTAKPVSRATSCPQDYAYAIAPLGVSGSVGGGSARIAIAEMRPQKHRSAPSGDQLPDYYMYTCDQANLERALVGIRTSVDVRPSVRTSRNGGSGRQLVILADRPIRNIQIRGDRRSWIAGYLRHQAWLGPERGANQMQRWWAKAGRVGRQQIEAALSDIYAGSGIHAGVEIPRTSGGDPDFPRIVADIRAQGLAADLAEGESRRQSRELSRQLITPILATSQPLHPTSDTTVVYNWGPGAAVGQTAGVLKLGSRKTRGGGWTLEAVLKAGHPLPAAIICHDRGIADVVPFSVPENNSGDGAIFDIAEMGADLGELVLPPGADKVAAGMRMGARIVEAVGEQRRRRQERVERVEATWKADAPIPGASITVQAPWNTNGVPYTLDKVLEVAEAVARGAGIDRPEAVTAALIADAAEGNRRWQYPARLAQIIDDIRRDQDLGVTDRYTLAAQQNGSAQEGRPGDIELAINQADNLLALAGGAKLAGPVIDLTDGSPVVGDRPDRTDGTGAPFDGRDMEAAGAAESVGLRGPLEKATPEN